MDTVVCTVLTGVGATAVMDLWGIARQRLLGMAAPNYGMVGRWIGHMSRGHFRHDSMVKVPPVRGERVIGWSAHYFVGIAFAALLPLIWGVAWFDHPTIVPALITGLATVAAPFLLMQPGMGAGIASSRTPRPGAARLQSLITHAIFGLGLYAAGSLASAFHAP